MSVAEKPPARMSKSVSSAAMMALEELIAPFDWKPVRHSQLTQDQMDEIHKALLIASAGKSLPRAFWDAIEFEARLFRLDGFNNSNDAKSLARALCDSRGALESWIQMANDGASNELLRDLLGDLGITTDTPSGTVYAETEENSRNVSIWFGRKAGKEEADLYGTFAIEAVRMLFNIPEAEDPGERQGVSPPVHSAPTIAESVPLAKARRSKTPNASSKAGRNTSSEAVPAGQSDSTKLLMVAVDNIRPADTNHRKRFDKAELQELADSIKQHGILQPLLLRPRPDAIPEYLIIAGERRWRAAKLAGLTHVPAQIVAREGLQASLAMFEENIRRVDLSPIERAQAIQTLMTEHQLSQKEVGKIIGVQQGQVSNELRLLNLPSVWQERVAAGTVAPTLIRPLLPYCDLPEVLEAIDMKPTGDDEDPIDEQELKRRLKNAILKLSRPIKYDANWQTYQKPSKEKRHFKTCSAEDLKALAPRTVDLFGEWEGRERTFNLELFDQLNKEPLAARVKKHGERKKERSAGSTKKESKKVELVKEFKSWELGRLIANQLAISLAAAVKACKDPVAVSRVAWSLALAGKLSPMFGPYHANPEKYYGRLIDFTQDPKAIVKNISTQLTMAIKDTELKPSFCYQLAEVLQVNILDDWKPSKPVLNLLTSADLEKCVEAVGRENLTKATKSPVDQLLAAWPAGVIPEFLREHFGVPKAAKAKKTKAEKAVAA